MQDGGDMAIFAREVGGTWTVASLGPFPLCPSRTVLPAEVRTAWGVTDPPYCSQTG